MNISSNNLRGLSQYSLLNKQEMANCRKGIWAVSVHVKQCTDQTGNSQSGVYLHE